MPRVIVNSTPLMTKLIENGFYITPEVFNLVKSEAGE